jgi:hypothetical protein
MYAYILILFSNGSLGSLLDDSRLESWKFGTSSYKISGLKALYIVHRRLFTVLRRLQSIDSQGYKVKQCHIQIIIIIIIIIIVDHKSIARQSTSLSTSTTVTSDDLSVD